ncbi:uncharacterized protein LOC116307192 [Actinia tenebrosa]|uniref:Uncharacterized protein LOC116307192 n=1 Tax=Actinia tenebrosa TaxID=6105 RepID=A0A6P8J106_ACTTE|nr:uncharacterized protein LOC116307192 [Actinia tenebrosa]
MAAHIMLLGKKCSSLTKENQLLSDKLNHVQLQKSTGIFSNINSYPPARKFYRVAIWMRGYKWRINLYPNGRNADAMGFLSLYLKRVEEDSQSLCSNIPNTANNESATPYRLTVISQIPEGHDVYYESKRVFTKNKGGIGGWSKFMKSSDVLSRCYVKDNRLTIKCTTHYPDKPQ